MNKNNNILVFKNILNAEKYARENSHHFESSSTDVGYGDEFCFRMYDDNFRPIGVAIVSDTLHKETEAKYQGD